MYLSSVRRTDGHKFTLGGAKVSRRKNARGILGSEQQDKEAHRLFAEGNASEFV